MEKTIINICIINIILNSKINMLKIKTKQKTGLRKDTVPFAFSHELNRLQLDYFLFENKAVLLCCLVA